MREPEADTSSTSAPYARSAGGMSAAGLSVRDVAADRAPVLYRNAARLARGLDEHRELARQQPAAPHVRVGRQRADGDELARLLYPAQLFEVGDAEELLLFESPRFEQHHQIRPARERPPHARLVAQQRQRVTQRARRDQLVTRKVSPHFSAFIVSFVARTTASKIFM